jgi:hypothetical protein
MDDITQRVETFMTTTIRTIRTLMVGVGISVAFQASLHAQESGKVGDLVRLSVSTLARPTDNRDSVAEDETDNVDYYIRPKLELVYETESSSLDVHYIPAFRFRTEPGDDQDETTWEHDFGLSASRAVSSRLRLRLNGAVVVQDDPAIEEGGIRMRGDQSYVRSVVKAGVNVDVMKYSNLDIFVDNRIKRYDDDVIARFSDEDSTKFAVAHRHQMTTTLRSLLTGSYSLYSYHSDAALERDFTSGMAAIGLENSFTPNVVGSIAVGSQTREYEDDGLDSDTSPYVNASLEGLLGEDTRVGGSFGMGVRDSDAYPFSSQEYSELRAFMDASLSAKLKLRVSATYRVSTYDIDSVPTVETVTTDASAITPDVISESSADETTVVGDAQLTYVASENATIFVGFRVEDIDSDVGQSYTKHIGRIGATLSL